MLKFTENELLAYFMKRHPLTICEDCTGCQCYYDDIRCAFFCRRLPNTDWAWSECMKNALKSYEKKVLGKVGD